MPSWVILSDRASQFHFLLFHSLWWNTVENNLKERLVSAQSFRAFSTCQSGPVVPTSWWKNHSSPEAKELDRKGLRTRHTIQGYAYPQWSTTSNQFPPLPNPCRHMMMSAPSWPVISQKCHPLRNLPSVGFFFFLGAGECNISCWNHTSDLVKRGMREQIAPSATWRRTARLSWHRRKALAQHWICSTSILDLLAFRASRSNFCCMQMPQLKESC